MVDVFVLRLPGLAGGPWSKLHGCAKEAEVLYLNNGLLTWLRARTTEMPFYFLKWLRDSQDLLPG